MIPAFTSARYAVAMLPKTPAFALFLATFAAVPFAHARGTIEKVQIKGLDKGDDAAIIENIEVSLSLYDTIGKAQGEAWAHTQLILDVVPGRGGMFSLDNGREKRFLSRGRVFDPKELAELAGA